jgi:hypothetical protein
MRLLKKATSRGGGNFDVLMAGTAPPRTLKVLKAHEHRIFEVIQIAG